MDGSYPGRTVSGAFEIVTLFRSVSGLIGVRMPEPCDEITDFELIRRMADREINFQNARIAWGCFYLRHQKFLLRICSFDYGYLLGEEEVKDLVNEAFMKAFDRGSTFDHAEVCDSIVQERKTRRWLAKIAGNLVRDHFRGQLEVKFVDDEDLEKLACAAHDNSNEVRVPVSERMKLLESGLALLTDVEQTVVRATMFWWQGNQEHQRMPHVAMDQLAKLVDKSPDNIRQIRSRAIKKLKHYINEALHNEKCD
jgi:RNA polymerase sigma factor (sigma-70 family)